MLVLNKGQLWAKNTLLHQIQIGSLLFKQLKAWVGDLYEYTKDFSFYLGRRHENPTL
jgi:hypothetical protein